MSPSQKILIALGVALILIGLFGGALWPLIGKLGLGRLPGDIRIERDGFSFYFPVTTMILVSLVATLIIRWFGR